MILKEISICRKCWFERSYLKNKRFDWSIKDRWRKNDHSYLYGDCHSYVALDRHILTWNFYFERYNIFNFSRKILIERYFWKSSINNRNFKFKVILDIYENIRPFWSWFYTQKWTITVLAAETIRPFAKFAWGNQG